MKEKSFVHLKRTIVAVHGKQGQVWWHNLPALLEKLAASCGLTLLPPFDNLTFHYVLPVLGPNQESWVLKLGVPHHAFQREISALEHYKGLGCVRLIRAHAKDGWILMERCDPGIALVELRNERHSIPIAASLMQRLWRPVSSPHQFISLDEWLNCLTLLDEHLALKNLIEKNFEILCAHVLGNYYPANKNAFYCMGIFTITIS